MHKRKILLSIVGLILVAGGLYCQDSEGQPTGRPGWLYATGSGTAATEEEALRLGKADAIGRVFSELGKDSLFQRMFLSDWPEAVEVESASTPGTAETGYVAEVRIAIDQNAVILAEGPYTAAATGLLNRAESLVADAETATRSAADDETELLLQAAFGGYSRAKSLLSEAGIVLSPLGDDTVFGDGGGNLSSLAATIASLSSTVESGLERIERLEAEIELEQGRRRYRETLALLENRLSGTEAAIGRHVEKSPFYDLAIETLESIRGELTTTLADLESIQENLDSLAATPPPDEELVRNRVELAKANARRLSAHAGRMIGEIDAEVAYPRLARQEDEARKRRRQEAASTAVRWVFLHSPRYYLSYSRFLPYLVDHRDGRGRVEPVEWQLAGEAAFVPGVWLRSALSRDVILGAEEPYRLSLHQTVALGVAGRRIWGLGFGWDWAAYADEENTLPLPVDSEVSFYLGRPNRELRRADVLLSLTYRIPRYWESFVLRYHLSGGLDMTVRLENFLVLEGMVRSGLYPAATGGAAAEGGSYSEDDLLEAPHYLDWRAGVGLRLPPPFAFKVYYGEAYESPSGRPDAESTRIRRGWLFSIEYTI